MKRRLLFIFVLALSVLSGQSVFAGGTPGPDGSNALIQWQDEKNDLYRRLVLLIRSSNSDDQKKGYELCKEYLRKFGGDKDEYVGHISKWVAEYEKVSRPYQFSTYISGKKLKEAFNVGKQILAEQDDKKLQLSVMIRLAFAGYEASVRDKNIQYESEALLYAKEALQEIEMGIIAASWSPFKDKTETEAWMNYVTGVFLFKKSESEAAPFFYKAIQFDSSVKKASYSYYAIAFFYEKKYEVAAKNYEAKYGALTAETPESKAEREKLNALLDRMIDAYARAVKYAEAEPTNQQNRIGWKERVTILYKFRKETTNGLDALINSVLNQQMKDPSTPW
jgi:hypothetical protein